MRMVTLIHIPNKKEVVVTQEGWELMKQKGWEKKYLVKHIEEQPKGAYIPAEVASQKIPEAIPSVSKGNKGKVVKDEE